MEGRILKIEQDYTQPGNRPGIIVTVRIPQPLHPGEIWVGGGPWDDERGCTIRVGDPANENHPKVKPMLDRWRDQMDEYHGFHVGTVVLTMPKVE